MKILRSVYCLLTTIALSGCGGMDSARDSYMSLHTKFANGFQDSSVEVSPGIAKLAKFEDLKIENQVSTFVVSGFVTYSKSCKFLTLEVKFVAKDGGVLGNARGNIQNYAANDKSRFRALFSNLPSSSRELLDKAKIDTLKCN